MEIQFKNVSKKYGDSFAVDSVNLEIPSGSFVCFIGTSGSGKTTTMRMINKMVTPTKGAILLDGKDIKSLDDISLRRSIGYVIQQIGLMPHMTIYENIVMVCKLLKWDKERMRETAERLIQAVDLPLSVLEQYPSSLSGGMQQRIGVIRALAADQEIILMDEPFGALDPITRDSLQELIKSLQVEMKKTVVFVTHDMDEALKLSDIIVIMDKGRVIQVGSPDEVLREPANEFVKELIGEHRLQQAEFYYTSVDDIMIKSPIKATVDDPVSRVATLMNKTNVDDIFIVNRDNVLVGRVDIRTLYRSSTPNRPIREIMEKVTYIKQGTSIQDALYYIQDLGFRNISVVDNQNHLVGLVTRGSLVKAIYNSFWGDYEPENAEQNAASSSRKTLNRGDEA